MAPHAWTIESIRNYYDPASLMENGRPLPATQGDYHYTEAITTRAVYYIRDHGRSDRPYLDVTSLFGPAR